MTHARFQLTWLLIGSVLLIGCGDDNDSNQAPTATPTLVATAVASVTPAPTGAATAPPTDTVRPEPSGTAAPTATATPESVLRGRVTGETGEPLAGVMVTAYDDAKYASVTVFTGVDGRYAFPEIPPGSYRMRARRIGWDDSFAGSVEVTEKGGTSDFSLEPTGDLNAQLPPTYFKSLLHWPNERVAGDFSRACANCHQIGDPRWREPRTRAQWDAVIDRMIGYGGVPFFEETREVLHETIASTFAIGAPAPRFAVPPPPQGDAVRAVIWEWEIDPVRRPGCHDIEIGRDGTVYTVGGVWTFNPRTGERARYPVQSGGHSVEPDANGDMWITAPGPEEIIKLDVTTKEFTHYKQPRIGDDLGSYPHTLRFDERGRIWYTLTRSNHVCLFDPATAEFTYYRLPPADPKDTGVPIPTAYGLDIAPNQTVWWSQLFGHRIGSVDPATGEVKSWRPPFDGPRRLSVGPDNVVWVPGYGSGELGRFDPVTETWKVYTLPTEPAGQELPYATLTDWSTGDVWITGSNSDTMIRFRPSSEEFTVFPLPTEADFTREIEFGDDGSVWTCTSDQELAQDRPGSGRIIKIEVRPPAGACGDGALELGEECDDGNAESCDGCSADCRLETGCGDGVACGAEECDDANARSCDGCSECRREVGQLCGDGVVNESCGEECDPSGDLCDARCQRVAVCGDGLIDEPEECDDGNARSCDGCSADCVIESGCGDGVVCGAEECDDGNDLGCDGCAACAVEVGARCGDGVVSATCGEQCDPPGDGCSVICTSGSGVLGARRITIGGSFYSSSLGSEVPLGDLTGTLDIAGGVIAPDGVAPLSVEGPVYYSAAILGGQFGTFCVRVDSCTGLIDCDGGTPVDVLSVMDSNGPGVNGLPPAITTRRGENAPAGALELDCRQTFVQLEPGAGDDCVAAGYPPSERIIYTTGTADALFVNGNPKVGTGVIRVSGEPFSCTGWQTTDGPGKLAGTFFVEEDRRAGDLANASVLDD